MYWTHPAQCAHLYVNTEGVVTLSTLSTGQESTLHTLSKTPTNHTHILKKTHIHTHTSVREQQTPHIQLQQHERSESFTCFIVNVSVLEKITTVLCMAFSSSSLNVQMGSMMFTCRDANKPANKQKSSKAIHLCIRTNCVAAVR